MDKEQNLLTSQLNDLAGQVIGAAMQVHSDLGPGLLESTYESCLAFELECEKLKVHSQVYLPIAYKGVYLDAGYRVDIIAEDSLIVELKAVESLNKLHTAQILAYMKLSKIRIGLLINFNVPHLRQGIHRVVNRF